MQCKTDYSMFICRRNDSFIIILAYLNDLLITRDTLEVILDVKNKLKDHFTIKDSGPLKYFLGLEFSYNNHNDIFISQRKYVIDLLSFSIFLDCLVGY